MATRYWIVSLPVQSSATTLWSRLQESIPKNSFDTPLYRFNIPNLRSNSFIEGCSHKIRR
ncbi:putative ATPase, V1 complex, subunit C, vacuolar ATP synthase subunit C superfamily [Helianthus annuus]|nr:putative ATPase, V1 complex, subunit C, vacuolar ATP synthase subunit C superfamily [Helianthus annuus]